MLKKYLWAAVLLGACGGGAGSSDQDNGGLSPMVDEDVTGWARIKSLPPQIGVSLGTDMELTTMTLVDGSFHLITKETRQLQGGGVLDRFRIEFAASAPADFTATHLTIAEMTNVYNPSASPGDYRYYFKPGTAQVYQSFRESLAETWSGIRTDGGVTLSSLRSPGGGAFAGLADVYEDGTALIPGTDLDSAYFRDGTWTRVYGRYSDLAEPTTYSSYPVQLASGAFYWAMLQDTAIAIGAKVPRPMIAGEEQVKKIVSVAKPGDNMPMTCYARAFGNQLVFLDVRKNYRDVTLITAYRWTEGATTIEKLYENVEVQSEDRFPSVLDNQPHRLLMDSDGGLMFFADLSIDGAVPSTALIHVDASGRHVDDPLIPPGAYLVDGPWLIDGQLYAGIGSVSGSKVPQLDLVKRSD